MFRSGVPQEVLGEPGRLQEDLDKYLTFYNQERAHRGYRTEGRTPDQAFLDGVKDMTQAEAA